MILVAGVNKYGLVKLPNTFRPSILDTNKDNEAKVNIHFGSNMDIVVIVARNKQLSRDDSDRIRYLTGGK